MNDILGKVRRHVARCLSRSYKISYAQCGEDLIIKFLFDRLKIVKPTYLDIGAHHPTWLSNTYLFYVEGSSGVCVEPDPDCYIAIKRKRRRDRSLNIGVGTGDQTQADFFIMSAKTLNTFSREEAERCQNTQVFGEQRIEKIVQIPVRTVNEIIEENFPNGVNLVSLDVEGMDFEIMRTFNFNRYRPEVFCIETLQAQDEGTLKKSESLINFMKVSGYLVYADTYINTIFVSEETSALL